MLQSPRRRDDARDPTMTDLDLMLRFMLQAIVVLGACAGLGWLGRRFLGQTGVVMEMVAGVVLGPSLLGALSPAAEAWLFPARLPGPAGAGTAGRHPSMMVLYVVAQIGLVLYMFLVGAEFDPRLLAGRVRGAVGVSLAGILAPFALGALIAAAFMANGGLFFAPEVGLGPRVLYLGAAMSITAFPMLARIIVERGIAGTSMGVLALGAGATDDAVAWSLLAVVLAVAKGSAAYAVYAIGGGGLFAALVLTLGKALFARLGAIVEREGAMSDRVFAAVILALLVGAYVTDAIGVYAVFGAFLVGIAMPKGRFAALLRARIEPLAVGVFLPFFFVFSGLNTRVGLIDTPYLWTIAALILVAATLGKGVACALAARLAGESWRDSAAIGTLMNARGLMELVILNIGLSQGIITRTLFATMVLMAIATTLMASPVFLRIMHAGDPRAATDGGRVGFDGPDDPD